MSTPFHTQSPDGLKRVLPTWRFVKVKLLSKSTILLYYHKLYYNDPMGTYICSINRGEEFIIDTKNAFCSANLKSIYAVSHVNS